MAAESPTQLSEQHGQAVFERGTTSPLGAELSPAATDLARHDPRRLNARHVQSLNASAGNAAVASLLQRKPAAGATRKGLPGRERSLEEQLNPAMLSDAATLDEAIGDFVPRLLSSVNGARFKPFSGSTRAHGANVEESVWVGSVSVAKLFAQDVIYNFSGSGQLLEVESNLSAPIDPAKPDEMPPPRFPLPPDGLVLIVEPATKRKWQAFRQNSGRLEMLPYRGPISVPEGMNVGQLVVFIYAPGHSAAVDGGPPVGWKAKAKAEPNEPPGWAKSQYQQLTRTLAGARGGKEAEPGAGSEGAGRTGTGAGGGGTDLRGQGTGATGTGPGADPEKVGGGRGGRKGTAKPGDRAKPDKVVLWQGKRGPMLNVWVGTSSEAVPLRPGESPESLRQRVEEVAARQRSTGERLANGASETGFEGGQGGLQPTPEELAEATATTATSMAYPSKIDMHGGSGAEVSPKGWATTVTGARHNFDMKLDRMAITFGFANQVLAEAEAYTFYWQVIDVTGMAIDATSKEGARGGAARAAQDKEAGRVEKVGRWSGVKAEVLAAAENASEDLEADRPDFSLSDSSAVWGLKAGELAIQGLSAGWDIAKSIVSEIITKMTEPENRRKIGFGKPGEYVVRCLANPVYKSKKGGGRATSIAAFPVRVVDMDERAMEVNLKEKGDIARLTRALADARAKLEKNPDDPTAKQLVDALSYQLGIKQAEAGQSTVQRLAAQKASLEDEILALQTMVANVRLFKRDRLQGLTGNALAAALRVEAQGLYSWWEWNNRLDDLKKARDAKEKQRAVAATWSAAILPGTEVRPRVTFASEENGALVQMEMILGQALNPMGIVEDRPRWLLLDVTSADTKGRYDGSSASTGPAGHSEAIRKAFQDFADKAAYGRGTLAIEVPDIPAAGGKPAVASTMLMKPGEFGRWQKRLQNLVEIAGMVAPFAKGAALARFASVGGAIDAGYRLYDRAANDRLEANFETLGDIMGLLTPFIEGAGKLSEKLTKTKAGYVLNLTARAGDIANELLMPAQIFHDIEQVVNDPSMGEPEKKAAISLILGRGVRDKVVQHLGEQHARSRVGAESAHAVPTGDDSPGSTRRRVTEPEAPGGEAGRRPASDDVEARAVATKAGTRLEATAVEPPAPAGRRPRPDRVAGAPPGGGPRGPRPRRLIDDPARLSRLIDGDPAEMRALAASGTWAETMNHFRNATDLAADLPPLAREAIMDGLMDHRNNVVGVLESFGGRPVGSASTEVMSDVDVNFRGPDAGRALLDAERFMNDRYGPLWRENYRMAFMVDATRLVAYESGPLTSQARIEIALRAETLRVARELSAMPRAQRAERLNDLPAGIDRAEVEQLAALGGAARIAQRDKALLAADQAAARLEHALDAVQQASRDGNAEQRARAEAERDAASRELTMQQMLANAMEGEAYIDPAAVKSFVLEPKDASALQGASEFYGAAREQLSMIEHLVADTPGGIGEAIHRYELLKYINRTVQVLEAAGYRDAQLTWLKKWSEYVYRVHRGATAKDRPTTPTTGDLTAKASRYDYYVTDVQPGSDMGPRERISGSEQQDMARFVADNYEMFVSVAERYVGELRVKAFETDTAAQAGRAPGESPGQDVPAGAEASSMPATAPEPRGGAPQIQATGQGRTGRPLLPSGQVPETLTQSANPAFEVARLRENVDRDAGRDLPASGVATASIPTAGYEPHVPGRYEPTGEKPTTGLSAGDSYVVVDTRDNTRHLFKPLAGEKPFEAAEKRGIRAEEQAPREVGGRMAAKELGIDVPGTRLVTIGSQQGVLIAWRDKNSLRDLALTDYAAFTRLIESEEFRQAMTSVDALDYLINNLDRGVNFGNYLYEFVGGKLHLTPIDHGFAFTSTSERAEITGKTRGLPESYDPLLAGRLRELHNNPDDFLNKIEPFVGKQAIPGIRHRLERMYQDMVAKEQAGT